MSQDKTDVFDRQQMIGTIFEPEGGVAVWLDRRDFGGARAAIRKSAKDEFCSAVELAAMGNAFENLIISEAASRGVELNVFIDMIGTAKEHLKKDMQHVTRIMPTGPASNTKETP